MLSRRFPWFPPSMRDINDEVTEFVYLKIISFFNKCCGSSLFNNDRSFKFDAVAECLPFVNRAATFFSIIENDPSNFFRLYAVIFMVIIIRLHLIVSNMMCGWPGSLIDPIWGKGWYRYSVAKTAPMIQRVFHYRSLTGALPI